MPKFTYKRGKDTIILIRKDRKTADRALELLCEFDHDSFKLVDEPAKPILPNNPLLQLIKLARGKDKKADDEACHLLLQQMSF